MRRLPTERVYVNLNNANNENIIRAPSTLNHGLHLHVIALGVESKDQQNRLIYLACNEGQDYLYRSQVLPWARFQKLIKQ
jgi:EAL domain-containing protein (putative c-di-GMP-specific phosphodiesterase class I)